MSTFYPILRSFFCTFLHLLHLLHLVEHLSAPPWRATASVEEYLISELPSLWRGDCWVGWETAGGVEVGRKIVSHVRGVSDSASD